MEGEERSMTAQHWLSQQAEFIVRMFHWESAKQSEQNIGLVLGHGKKRSVVSYQLQ